MNRQSEAVEHGREASAYHLMLKARAFMDASLDQPLDLDWVAAHVGYSRYHFLRLFREVFHQTPHQYLTDQRIERAKVLLAEGGRTVTEVCLAVGFESLGSFSALFTRKVGHSPALHQAHILEARDRRVGFIPYCFLRMSGVIASDN